MACEPGTIASESTCFTCRSEKQLAGMQVYLLAQFMSYLDPEFDASAEAIAKASNCYTCRMSGKGLLGAMVYLLCQIEENVIVGSGLTFSTGTGSPEGVVTGSPGDTYWDTATSFYYVKVTGTSTDTGWAIH